MRHLRHLNTPMGFIGNPDRRDYMLTRTNAFANAATSMGCVLKKATLLCGIINRHEVSPSSSRCSNISGWCCCHRRTRVGGALLPRGCVVRNDKVWDDNVATLNSTESTASRSV